MKLLGIIIFALLFVKCASLKLEENPPFAIKEATYSYWVGGMPGSGGMNISMYLEAATNVTFDSIYFKGRRTKAQVAQDKKGNFISGKFYNTNKKQHKDLQLHKDSAKEYGNELPKKEDKIPFELKENEAILSYSEKGETKYYKVKNVTKGKKIIRQ